MSTRKMPETANELNPHEQWIAYPYPWDDAPLDLSFIYKDEKPAGKHGFVTVKGDKFAFEDGAPARFWGTCFNSAANFPPHAEAEKVARRLAKFGVNMMRTHQMDAEWSTPNIFQFAKGDLPKDTLTLDPRSMDRLDYLIHCLKQEGIYTYIDLLTYRRFKPGDGVDAVDQLGKAAKPYSNFDRRMIELQKKFAHDLWTHVNPYTGLAYKDDPAIAMMEIANENDLLNGTPTSRLQIEPYRSRLKEMYLEWGRQNNVDANPEELGSDDKPKGNVLRFLHAIQVDFYKEMFEYLRGIGVKTPITGSNWTRGLALLSAHSDADFMDTHPYWDMWSDVRGNNKVMIAEKRLFWSDFCCRNRLLDKPLFISEWDSTWPNEWRAESVLTLAALSALHDWAEPPSTPTATGIRRWSASARSSWTGSVTA